MSSALGTVPDTAQSRMPIDCWVNSTSRGRLVFVLTFFYTEYFLGEPFPLFPCGCHISQDSELKEELRNTKDVDRPRHEQCELSLHWQGTIAKYAGVSFPKCARISSVNEVERSVCTGMY